MSKFSFGKRAPEEEGIPPEPIEGETEVRLLSDVGDGGSWIRRPMIFAGIGIVLIGGLYLASILFFSEPPPPPVPTRPGIPAPATTVPTPQAQAPVKTKDAAPGLTTQAPTPPVAKAEVKAETKTTVPLPPAKTAEPAKPTPPVKSSAPAAKVETKAPPKRAVPSGKGFSVQVGAMAQQANAENLKKKLDALGYQAIIRKGSGFANSHVVTVGEPTGKGDAEALIRRLGVDGFPSTLASAEGKYAPQVGSFVNLDEAIDMARELQKKNYRPKITSKPSTTSIFQVRHGQFDTREAAMKRGEEIKSKGLSAWVVPN